MAQFCKHCHQDDKGVGGSNCGRCGRRFCMTCISTNRYNCPGCGASNMGR